MFPLFLPMLLGGAMGAATSKDPLKGALLGAGMGAAGGAFMPGLLGGSAAASGASGAAAATGMPAAGAFQASAAAPFEAGFVGTEALTGANGGLLGTLEPTLEKAGKYAGLANMAGLLNQPESQQPAPQPMPQYGTGHQTLAAIAQQGEQAAQGQIESAAQARKKRRMGLLGAA